MSKKPKPEPTKPYLSREKEREKIAMDRNDCLQPADVEPSDVATWDEATWEESRWPRE